MPKRQTKRNVNLSRADILFLRQNCTSYARTLRRIIKNWGPDEGPVAERMKQSLTRIQRIRASLNEALRG